MHHTAHHTAQVRGADSRCFVSSLRSFSRGLGLRSKAFGLCYRANCVTDRLLQVSRAMSRDEKKRARA